MKIALIGAGGTIGQRILKEALDRGHQVTVIARNPAGVSVQNERLSVAAGDIFDAAGIAKAAEGHDAVISAYGPKTGEEQELVRATRSLIEGVKRSGVGRLLAVGGAGSLEVAPGVKLIDMPGFPDFVKPIAAAHSDALDVLRQETELDWVSFSPAGLIEPGERTGRYRKDKDRVVVNEQGESRISAEDYAVAMLDEAERPAYHRERFTAAN
ncbi:NAD(P)-dependent oxidoreductase [Paenibacillus filicis]|uniref:NAD(P)-dependent oxidoreductase n=1 Tax=Paenibacillus gyeongsangnamensis TaxID=3388067 RepID=A0ABT4QCB3_9BACL|nr:NAD(P)-dependent oxidoreductase [Paenibacillus filicis]MCZ8514486.1 NAD(P)-dependent oxidoreductase [Paenibacillus filicis]